MVACSGINHASPLRPPAEDASPLRPPAPDGLQLPFRAGAIGIPTHRPRTGITDDSRQENRIQWSTTQITGLLAFRSSRQICRRQICCVAVESQFLRGVKDGADIGYGLVGAARPAAAIVGIRLDLQALNKPCAVVKLPNPHHPGRMARRVEGEPARSAVSPLTGTGAHRAGTASQFGAAPTMGLRWCSSDSCCRGRRAPGRPFPRYPARDLCSIPLTSTTSPAAR